MFLGFSAVFHGAGSVFLGRFRGFRGVGGWRAKIDGH